MKPAKSGTARPSADHTIRDAVMHATVALKDRAGALLPVLHAVQAALGCVPEEAIVLIAHELNLSRADVHGVVTFYHYFRAYPAGRRTIYVCRAESCQAMGSATLERHIRQRLGVDFHETTADGAWTLEPVYCLGVCACSPAMKVDDALKGRMTPERFDAWLLSEGE